MKQYIKILSRFLFLWSLILPFTACQKESVVPPATLITPIIRRTPISAGEHIFDNLSWHFNYLYEIWALTNFANLSGSVIRDSAYYNDHIQVFLKFAGDSVWKSVAYVPNNHLGQTPLMYFMVNNIISSDERRIVESYMEILGKPVPLVDFSLNVSVKVIIAP